MSENVLFYDVRTSQNANNDIWREYSSRAGRKSFYSKLLKNPNPRF